MLDTQSHKLDTQSHRLDTQDLKLAFPENNYNRPSFIEFWLLRHQSVSVVCDMYMWMLCTLVARRMHHTVSQYQIIGASGVDLAVG